MKGVINMVMVLGQGQITPDKFISILVELGFADPHSIFVNLQKHGKATIKNMRVLYVR